MSIDYFVSLKKVDDMPDRQVRYILEFKVIGAAINVALTRKGLDKLKEAIDNVDNPPELVGRR